MKIKARGPSIYNCNYLHQTSEEKSDNREKYSRLRLIFGEGYSEGERHGVHELHKGYTALLRAQCYSDMVFFFAIISLFYASPAPFCEQYRRCI